MKVIKAFRNLDRHGRQRAPEVIDEEAAQVEKRLTRFPEDLVHLEVTVTQTRGKKRLLASLRLGLPSGVIAAREEGFEIEPVLHKAFADLRHRLEHHLAHLKGDWQWKRPSRRARIGALLPPARDKAEAERRELYFDLIEDHLDDVYNQVRRELTYVESNGEVTPGRLSVGTLVDATVLKGLETFENRGEFSTGDWLRKIALETVEAEARAARESIPAGTATLDREPEVPAEEPTESDQERFEFYQPDDVLLLEDLIPGDTGEEALDEVEQHELSRALHRAVAGLPALWRNAVAFVDIDEMPVADAAAVLGLSEPELEKILDMAQAYLRAKLEEAGKVPEDAGAEHVGKVIRQHLRATARVPQPVRDRDSLTTALSSAKA